MNRTTEKLHQFGQSLWLDNITHRLLASGALLSYIQELSNHWSHVEPNHLRSRHQEQQRITMMSSAGSWMKASPGEVLFFDLALERLEAGRR